MNVFPVTGIKSDLHELSHGGFGNLAESSASAMAKGMAWHLKHFAYLVQKFRDTPEGTGNLLDHTAMLYLSEGGFGWDPSSNSGNSPHSTENMAVLLAGRAGGLKPGQHIVATNKHPANVVLTALNAVGANASSFGEVAGEIPGLR